MDVKRRRVRLSSTPEQDRPPPPAAMPAVAHLAKRDQCVASLELWKWGIIAGGAAVLIALVVCICLCCRRKQKDDSNRWAMQMMSRWHHRKSVDSVRSAVKPSPGPPPAEKSVASGSFAAIPAMPTLLAQPTYLVQTPVQQLPQPAQSVAHSRTPSSSIQPDALYPRPAPAQSSAAPLSFAKRLFGRGDKSVRIGGSDSGSRSAKSKRTGTLPAPTVYGSEGGSSYHSKGPNSNWSASRYAFSANGARSKVAPSSATGAKSSASRSRRGPASSEGGSSYHGGSEVAPSASGEGISSDFVASDWASSAPSRSATNFSQSAAPSQGPSRLRQVMNMT